MSLGHVVLHSFRDPGDDAEKEANQFAGALLLPASRVDTLVDARTTLDNFARVKALFGVSIQASIYRAAQARHHRCRPQSFAVPPDQSARLAQERTRRRSAREPAAHLQSTLSRMAKPAIQRGRGISGNWACHTRRDRTRSEN
ncbi:ImmA/IrrE family metallo-endopeptidase [Demequina litorisediminis]|uniref:ImmA/IrrE family metallo-endopeptidase n=1 Tax=Demequina litorisediminis TaxID=1849022 RepID=UPI003D667119